MLLLSKKALAEIDKIVNSDFLRRIIFCTLQLYQLTQIFIANYF